MNKIMKPLVAAAIPVLTALGSWIATGEWNAAAWSLAITGLLTAAVVAVLTAVLPDEADAFLAKWGKAIGAALTPLASALIQYLFVPGSTTKAQLATAFVGFVTAALMAYIKNTPDS